MSCITSPQRPSTPRGVSAIRPKRGLAPSAVPVPLFVFRRAVEERSDDTPGIGSRVPCDHGTDRSNSVLKTPRPTRPTTPDTGRFGVSGSAPRQRQSAVPGWIDGGYHSRVAAMISPAFRWRPNCPTNPAPNVSDNSRQWRIWKLWGNALIPNRLALVRRTFDVRLTLRAN